MVKVTYKGETRDIPKRYLPDTLKGKDRQKQIKSIFENKDRPKTKVKDKKSSWTVKFDEKYGDELDAMMRHILDEDWGQVAWRALANLEKQIEKGYKG